MTDGVARMRLPVHWATRYLHVVITEEPEAITVEDRRTLAGVIPVGHRRVRVPYAELREVRLTNVARWTCLVVTAAIAVTVALTSLPLVVDLVLGAAAALFALMTFIRGVELTRDDGRSWTFPICRTHEFDASLCRDGRDAAARRRPPVELSRALAEPPGPTDVAACRSLGARASCPDGDLVER